MILLFGAPRSGTSWLAKIFDSHPDVFYRHEPDLVEPTVDIPFLCVKRDTDELLEAAREYLSRMVRVRTLHAAGSLPIFQKRYYNPLQMGLRRAWIYGIRALEMAFGAASFAGRLRVPDLVDPGRTDIRVVIKSVGAMGRLSLFTRAVPGSRSIVVVRHPCGQVGSVLRGIALGKLAKEVPVVSLAETEQARRRGLTAAELGSMPQIEQVTWRWVLINEKAIDDVEGVDGVMVIRYEDLCDEPVRVAREMFEFTGLGWEPQTEAFLARSTHHRGAERYFQLVRDSKRAASRWRAELTPAQIDTILGIAGDSRPGRMYASSSPSSEAASKDR